MSSHATTALIRERISTAPAAGIALVTDEGTLTWAELATSIGQWNDALDAADIPPGGVVRIELTATIASACAALGIICARRCLSPVAAGRLLSDPPDDGPGAGRVFATELDHAIIEVFERLADGRLAAHGVEPVVELGAPTQSISAGGPRPVTFRSPPRPPRPARAASARAMPDHAAPGALPFSCEKAVPEMPS